MTSMLQSLDHKYQEICSKLDAGNVHLESIAGQMRNGGQPIPTHQVTSFDISASGWNQIIAPRPTRIAVMSYVIVANGTVTFAWGQGDSAANAGQFPSVASATGGGGLRLVSNTGVSAAIPWPSYLFSTEQNQGLMANLSGAVAVGGYVTYVLLAQERETAS